MTATKEQVTNKQNYYFVYVCYRELYFGEAFIFVVERKDEKLKVEVSNWANWPEERGVIERQSRCSEKVWLSDGTTFSTACSVVVSTGRSRWW